MEITVRAIHPDGSEKYNWPAEVLDETGDELVVKAVFSKAHAVGSLRVAPGDVTVEHYFFSRRYNICRIYRSGTLLGIYCNLATPARRQPGAVSYVDLELDLFVHPDGRYDVLDVDKFERLAASTLDAESVRVLRADWALLVSQVERGQGVFAETKGPVIDAPA